MKTRVYPRDARVHTKLAQCDVLLRRIDSTDRGLIWSTVSPWLYQSRAVAKRRPETDTTRVILWVVSIRGLYWIYFNPISLFLSMIP